MLRYMFGCGTLSLKIRLSTIPLETIGNENGFLTTAEATVLPMLNTTDQPSRRVSMLRLDPFEADGKDKSYLPHWLVPKYCED